MKIVKLIKETDRKPYALVEAFDEPDAEIFAQENAAKMDDWFEGLEAGTAHETSDNGIFHVPFS